MGRTLTPCMPWKSCLICESRMYPKAASPEKKAAKLAHQAAQYGHDARLSVYADGDDAYLLARAAFRFAGMALALNERIARAA